MNPSELSHFLTHCVLCDASCVVPVILLNENFFRGRPDRAMELPGLQFQPMELV